MKTRVNEYEYTIFLHAAEEGGFIAEVPALPGCVTQGETLDETIEHAKDAINLYIQTLVERKRPVPKEKNNVIVRVKGTIPRVRKTSLAHA